ncbi:hypothetical protein GCM10010988_14440 [Cnuibacter physcomitrellae]|uniref:Antitoxin n=1 Tax=Cnuibacter physcomitrellae TaxID=1619308 RepID=A0A1X9LPL2_9MICO|nr:type II toxin-antitoxin system prevent-host-death family antitoxin [Cnuibacter physcomitrellae]ARJ06238.1 hypothetical protein B5808_14200 [Cnuibacter physcomitrellae]GGI37532.1 hypothetical protein GCM10010988_14440 [Cnuibacter physcomitrellae]
MEMNVQQARDNLSRLIAAAEAGEDVTITRRGRPAVRLVPVREESPRRWNGKDLAAYLEEGGRFRGTMTADEIRDYIHGEREAWD